MLATYTLGNSCSPTTTAVMPAASAGLAAAVGVAVQATETDADGNKTAWQLDSQGRPLVGRATWRSSERAARRVLYADRIGCSRSDALIRFGMKSSLVPPESAP
jgi:YD repeat-containing protein